MKCKSVRSRLSDHLNQELNERTRLSVERHLQTCPACSSELAMVKQVVRGAGALKKKPTPDSLWLAIERELDAEPTKTKQPLISGIIDAWESLLSPLASPAPVFKIAGVLAVLALGIVIGRNFRPSDRAVSLAPIREQLPAAEFASRTNSYIEKSRVLFLGVVNADAAHAKNSNWTSERKMAGNLIREASFLKENMPAGRSGRIKHLVEELELILFEIANLEEQEDIENIDLIKGGIDRKGLMLKIYLYEPAQDAPSRKTLM